MEDRCAERALPSRFLTVVPSALTFSFHSVLTLQDGVRSQTTPGDILVHSDEASIDDEQAPARKKTKFSPAVEESEEQRKHGEKKGRKVTKKAAKLAAAEEGARA